MEKITELGTKDFYWGLVPREEMQAFLLAADKEGFEKARTTFKFSGRFDYADDFRRGDFHFFLPIPASGHVLDLGSGFGNVTIPLASHYSQITAADASRELLELCAVRAKERNLTNISFARIDPIGSGTLPFADSMFDAVIMNGVFEWIGLSDTARNPRKIQNEVLADVLRILKPGGILYIGIENRWFPGWLRRDPHSKLWFTVIMPRMLASLYCRLHGQVDGYRTYIYSYVTYLRMFRKAGFDINNVLIPYTGYRDPIHIYPRTKEVRKYLFAHGHSNTIYTARWSKFLRILYFFKMEHVFISSYLFVLGKGAQMRSSRLERLLERHERYDKGDILMKHGGTVDCLYIRAFKPGSSQSYGIFEVPRFGAGEVRFRVNK